MREFKGTPGPWEVSVFGGDTNIIRAGSMRSEGGSAFSYQSVVLCVDDEDDARLMSASPELLEALQLAKHVIENMLPANSASRTRVSEMAGKAISKALGD